MHGNAEKYTQGLYDGYREAMLWAEEDRITEELKANGVAEPDLNIHTSFSPSAIAKIQKDLTDFTAKYSETIELFKEEEQTDDSQVGHSFWLTRQGHGAGFFDFSGEAANVLYKACDWQGEFSELNYYVGDDNLIYFMGFEDTVGDPAPAEVEASINDVGEKSFTRETSYTGDDGIEYKARATVTIEADGHYYIDVYDYFDPDTEEWVDTEERSKWSKDEIFELFPECSQAKSKAGEVEALKKVKAGDNKVFSIEEFEKEINLTDSDINEVVYDDVHKEVEYDRDAFVHALYKDYVDMVNNGTLDLDSGNFTTLGAWERQFNTSLSESNDYWDIIVSHKVPASEEGASVEASKKVKVKVKAEGESYWSIVYLSGEGFEEFEKILDEQGEEAALNYLAQWDYGGESEVDETSAPWGKSDTLYRKDDYVMSYNAGLSYASLARKVKTGVGA